MSGDLDDEIVHRQIDTGGPEPAVQIAEIVADLDGKGHEELTSAWSQIDNMLTEIFSDPPDPEAQVQVQFTYEGYRVTVEQNGSCEFVKVT